MSLPLPGPSIRLAHNFFMPSSPERAYCQNGSCGLSTRDSLEYLSRFRVIVVFLVLSGYVLLKLALPGVLMLLLLYSAVYYLTEHMP